MQAVTGFERAVDGAGNDPLAATWILIDMSGGWVAAAGMLAGLYARAAHGGGSGWRPVRSAPGCCCRAGCSSGTASSSAAPELDAQQTGYGPGYWIYEGSDGHWFALVLPAPEAWQQLASLLEATPLPGAMPLPGTTALPEAIALPAAYAPPRGGAADAAPRTAETVLEAAFATAPAAEWAARLRGAGLLAELIEPLDRDGFRREILGDPVNRPPGTPASCRLCAAVRKKSLVGRRTRGPVDDDPGPVQGDIEPRAGDDVHAGCARYPTTSWPRSARTSQTCRPSPPVAPATASPAPPTPDSTPPSTCWRPAPPC